MARHTRTIGLMRFSVLTPTYYSERFDSLEKIAAHIFADDRMALRFGIFERLVLPSLVNQSDDGFDLVVLTAESMPPKHLDRLKSLLEPYAHIHCRPVGTDKHYQLLKEGYNSVDVGEATHRVLFRLDDDDAVDLNYIRRLKWSARTLEKMHGADARYVIAFNRGYYIRFTPEGEPNEVFDACERAPLSTGTALVAPVDYPRNPYRYNHRALAQYYNTYSDITVPAFIRTIHGDNKSNPTQMGLTHKMRPRKMDAELIEHFGTTLDTLQAL